MAYTTESIIRAESPFKNSATIESAYVTRAITQADSLIDSKIVNAYQLPLSETPAIIQDISTKLAIINLLTDQSLNIEIASGVDVEDMADRVMKLLDSISKREIKLIGSTGSELTTTGSNEVSSYPSQSSTDDGDTSPIFTIDQQF